MLVRVCDDLPQISQGLTYQVILTLFASIAQRTDQQHPDVVVHVPVDPCTLGLDCIEIVLILAQPCVDEIVQGFRARQILGGEQTRAPLGPVQSQRRQAINRCDDQCRTIVTQAGLDILCACGQRRDGKGHEDILPKLDQCRLLLLWLQTVWNFENAAI